MKTDSINSQIELPHIKVKVPPHPVPASLNAAEKDALKQRIRDLLRAQNAVLVSHYYVDGDLQALAEETGGCVADSLEMARFGTHSDADTLMVCGVRFMGETAKILNPEKRVLMPDLDATCSLVALDGSDRPVTVSPTGEDQWNVVVWMDHRAIEQALAAGEQTIIFPKALFDERGMGVVPFELPAVDSSTHRCYVSRYLDFFEPDSLAGRYGRGSGIIRRVV